MFKFHDNGSYMMPAHFGPRPLSPKSSGWYRDVTMMVIPFVTDRDRLAAYLPEPYEVAEPGDGDAVSFVKVGKPIRDCEMRLADDADQVLDAGRVGNIQLRGASVTERIYGDEAATAALFTDDGWLRTGDLGAVDILRSDGVL